MIRRPPEGAHQRRTSLSGIGAFIEDNFEEQAKAKAKAQPETAAPQAKKPAATDKEATAIPEADGGSRLVLKAKAPVWVRIEDAQGSEATTEMLRGGDTYSVPNRAGLVVIARDGGSCPISSTARNAAFSARRARSWSASPSISRRSKSAADSHPSVPSGSKRSIRFRGHIAFCARF